MRTRSFLSLICHATVWGILGVAFLIVSVPRVWQAAEERLFGPILPFHTTNSYLVSLLKIQDGSERLLHALAALPPERPLAVILPDGHEESIFLSYVVSYFAWPREVRCLPVTRTNAAHLLQSLDRPSLGAIFFCQIDPPPYLQPVIRVGVGISNGTDVERSGGKDAVIFLGLVTGVLTVMAAGVGATLLVMRGVSRINLLESGALSWLFGTGIISLLLWGGGFLLSGAALQMLVTVAAIALAALGFASSRQACAQAAFPRPRNILEWILGGVIALEILVMIHGAFAHGLGWDGLLNWEVKARYAFLNDGVIPAAYYHSETRAFTHPAYPLLIPMTELWLYLWMGEANQFWIKIIFPLYYAAGAILLATTVRRLTNQRWPGLVAAVFLFFVPFLTNSPGDATGGYVDVPLSIFYFATMAYLLLHAVSREAYTLRIFAVSLALLPWAKREGAILWSIGALCGTVVVWRGWRTWRSLLWLVPGAVIIVAWKIFVGAMQTTESREFVPMTFAALSGNFPRILPIGRMVLEEMMTTMRWSLFWPCLALAFGSLAWRARDPRLLILAFAMATPIMLYATTYVFSSWPDYSIHFQASFPRLLLQVMPIGWLVIALALPWRATRPSPSGTR